MSRTIIDPRCVTRSDSAIFLERWPHFGQISDRGSRTNMFIRINRDVAFAMP